jgi:hypothetical protein
MGANIYTFEINIVKCLIIWKGKLLELQRSTHEWAILQTATPN